MPRYQTTDASRREALEDGTVPRLVLDTQRGHTTPALHQKASPGLSQLQRSVRHGGSPTTLRAIRARVVELFGAPSAARCDSCYAYASLPGLNDVDGAPAVTVHAVTVHADAARGMVETVTMLRERTRIERGISRTARLDNTVDVRLCTECLGSFGAICEDCGQLSRYPLHASGGDIAYSPVGDGPGLVSLCAPCRAAHGLSGSEIVECASCGLVSRRLSEVAGLERHEGRWYHQACLANCRDCGVRSTLHGLCPTASGRVCERCSVAYTECDGCQTLVHRDRLTPDDLCRPCSSARESEVIGPYHSSGWQRSHAVPTAWTLAHGGRFFGVELEVENADRYAGRSTTVACARRVLEVANGGAVIAGMGRLVHAEGDGSLANGFELVSRPLDLDGQRQLWSRVLTTEVTDGLRSHNTETCGLHVHLTRASLTRLQLARMVVCLNSPNWERLVRAIARRYQTGYCHIDRKTLGGALSREVGGKYDALNVSRDRTVEFRIFRGSLNAAAVIAAIEFCHALAEFCAMPTWAASTTAGDLSASAFVAFLSLPEIRNETRTLRAYLKGRGQVIEAKETRPRAASAPVVSTLVRNENDDSAAVATPGTRRHAGASDRTALSGRRRPTVVPRRVRMSIDNPFAARGVSDPDMGEPDRY